MLDGDAEKNIVSSDRQADIKEQEKINSERLTAPTEIKEPLPVKEKLPSFSSYRHEQELNSPPQNSLEYQRLQAYIDVHFNLYRGQSLRPGWPVIRTPLECLESLLRLSIIENDEKEIKKRFQAIELLIANHGK